MCQVSIMKNHCSIVKEKREVKGKKRSQHISSGIAHAAIGLNREMSLFLPILLRLVTNCVS